MEQLVNFFVSNFWGFVAVAIIVYAYMKAKEQWPDIERRFEKLLILMEECKGLISKWIDVNSDGKVTKEEFEMLRKEFNDVKWAANSLTEVDEEQDGTVDGPVEADRLEPESDNDVIDQKGE